jgi:hypothetical protein
MWTTPAAALWRAAYLRAVRSAFATVPLYRERWALEGRVDPVLVPGRTGRDGGAIDADEAIRKMVDLVPLAGGAEHADPARGLGHVLPAARPVGVPALVVLADASIPAPPVDLPKGMRGAVVDPEVFAGDCETVARSEVISALRRGEAVAVVGPDKSIAKLSGALPEDVAHRPACVPHRNLDSLDGGPYGVLHDPLLGYFGALRSCGRWHLDWRRVYARTTSAGIACTLLRQRSPRLVDILVAGGVRGAVGMCPRHGTPVVRA